jgi:hypothetical protein
VQLDSEGLRSLAFGFKRRAWRLEVLQAYSIENEKEEFEKFLRGEKPPADYEYPWRDYVKKATGEGKAMGRVHLVARPLTYYVRYQFDWGYAHTVPVGEDVRILDLSTTSNPGLPDEDFWLFDDAVVRMIYDSDGVHLGQELVDEPGALERYEQYQKLAIDNSVPFSTYWPQDDKRQT